jgi:DNA-binding response OmpR family regulator
MAAIVVAEDDPDIADMIVFRLEQAGHEVRRITDGLDVLAAVTADIDLLILDLRLPHQSGLDLCRDLRSGSGRPDLPVLMVTAQTLDADIERGFQAGCDDYLTKPFTSVELTQRVEALLTPQQP